MMLTSTMTRRGSAIAVVTGIAMLAVAPATASAAPAANPPFKVVTNVPYTFGQAPVWDSDGQHVIFNEPDQTVQASTKKTMQIYRSKLDGSQKVCLTCGAGAPAAPNMVPTVRPQGDKIMYHSWNGHAITFGAPGFGGVGSQIWVMDPDGKNHVQLTGDIPDPYNPGTFMGDEGKDNFHAYWSPDGNHIAWTHGNYDFIHGTANQPGTGTSKWSIFTADYVASPKPHLANVKVRRPENGHFYETQWWAPDGSGFLFTESVSTTTNLELFFYDVTKPEAQAVTHLSDGNTSWDEQATFTKDMSRVIWMSTRNHPGTWNQWSSVVATVQPPGDPNQFDVVLLLPLFFGTFFNPANPPSNDLWEIKLAPDWRTATTHPAIRQLTHDGDEGWITPEFSFDPAGNRLLWTEIKIYDGVRIDSRNDPGTQVNQTLGFLMAPPSAIDAASGVLSGGQFFYVTERTRVGQFDLSDNGSAATSGAVAAASVSGGLPPTSGGAGPGSLPGLVLAIAGFGVLGGTLVRRRGVRVTSSIHTGGKSGGS